MSELIPEYGPGRCKNLQVEVFLVGTHWFEYGVPVYRDQPAGTRQATAEDFIVGGIVQVEKWLLLQSYFTGYFEAYRITGPSFTIDKVEPWLKDGRVYVKE